MKESQLLSNIPHTLPLITYLEHGLKTPAEGSCTPAHILGTVNHVNREHAQRQSFPNLPIW